MTASLFALAEAALPRLVTALRRARSIRAAVWAITEQAIASLKLHDCVVYLLEADGEHLRQVAAHGPKQAARGVLEGSLRLRLGQGIVGTCALERRLIRVDDTRLDPRYVVDDQPRLSELSVPIVAGDRLLGVLDSEHPEPGYFNADYERVLGQIASLAGERLAELIDQAAERGKSR